MPDEVLEKYSHPEYIGDGVYAKYDGYHIILMANDHINPTDTIALDPHVVAGLMSYISRLNESLRNLKGGG